MTQRSYRRKAPDLIEALVELTERVKRLETYPRLTTTSLDSGELVLKGGDIVIENDDGLTVLRIQHGDAPQLVFYPSGSAVASDYKIAQYGWESETSGTALETQVQDGSGNGDGGKVLLMQSAAYFSHQPSSGSESFYGAGIGNNGQLYMKGKFGNNYNFDGEAAVICGSVAVASGVSSYSHTYSTASVGTMIPVVQMVNAAALAGCLTAQSNSGFTFAWTGTLAKTINYWSFRI